MSIIRYINKFIFIVYLFDALNVNISLYKLCQTYGGLTKNKLKSIIYLRTEGVKN
jgi:hypothetical protein